GKSFRNQVVPRAQQLTEFDEGWPQFFKGLTQAHRRVFVFLLMKARIAEPVEGRKLAVQRETFDDAIKAVACEYRQDLPEAQDDPRTFPQSLEHTVSAPASDQVTSLLSLGSAPSFALTNRNRRDL